MWFTTGRNRKNFPVFRWLPTPTAHQKPFLRFLTYWSAITQKRKKYTRMKQKDGWFKEDCPDGTGTGQQKIWSAEQAAERYRKKGKIQGVRWIDPDIRLSAGRSRKIPDMYELLYKSGNHDSTGSSQNSTGKCPEILARYNKLKRTYEALSSLVVETKADLDHLESIATSLSLSEDEKDLNQSSRNWLITDISRAGDTREQKSRRNQNPCIIFHLTASICMWEKIIIRTMNWPLNLPTAATGGSTQSKCRGSHVIVRKEQAETLPDATFEEAGRLAAWLFSGKTGAKSRNWTIIPTQGSWKTA